MTQKNIQPPVARKTPHHMLLHGVSRTDDYYWMRDDERQNPEVIAHLQAENAYTESEFAPCSNLQQVLFEELTSRLQKDESSVPYQWQQHWYGSKYIADAEYPLLVRSATYDGPSQCMLDTNKRAADQEFYSLAGAAVSPDETLLVFAEDTVGRRIYRAHVKDLQSNTLLTDRLEGLDSAPVWANDNLHLFYIAKDEQTLLGNRVYRHRLGSPQSADVLVYQEHDESFYLSLGKTLDGSHLVLTQESTVTSEVSLLDANQPLTQFISVLAREVGHEYSVYKLGEQLYILTNWQANNFRLMQVPLALSADKQNWQEVIAHEPTTRIEDVLLLQHHLIIQNRHNGHPSIDVHPLNGQASYSLEFDDAAYVVGIDVNAQQKSQRLRIYYSSMTTPETIYEYDLNHANHRVLLKQQVVVGDFNPERYQSERLLITARDGVQVPVSLVYRRDYSNQMSINPLYVYGYGAYGYTIEPDFSSSVLSLLDRGFIYAIAHVRGGEMLGRDWYDAGRLLNKQHTFNDFVDVTKGLVALGYGHQDKVVAAGGSAGGLLMGAVINQAPDLYHAVAAHVPFVDIVTTMLDESIPLTTNEYDEWGNPNDKQYFDYMLSYSPYDQVKAQDYPHLLVTTGFHDSQVQYFEPAKWVAKLREYKTDNHQLLFHIDMDAGHGGKSGRYQQYQDTAREYAFFIDLLGLNPCGV